MERCSSSTSTHPQVRKTSLNPPPKCLLLFLDKDNASGFALRPQTFSSWPCGTAPVPEADAGHGEQSCPPGTVSGTHGLAALGPRRLPAREAETGRLHTGLLFSLSFLPPLWSPQRPLHFFKCICPVSVSFVSYNCFRIPVAADVSWRMDVFLKKKTSRLRFPEVLSGSLYSLFSRERLLSTGAWSTCHYWSRHRTLLRLPQPSRKNELVNEALAMGPQ